MIMRAIRLIFVLLALFCASMGAGLSAEQVSDESADATDQEAETASCCGGTVHKWHYQRLIDGEIIDQGFITPVKGRYLYDVQPCKTGGMLYVAALAFPLDESESPFDYKPETRYYNARIPEFGLMVAVEHEPGETWEFSYNGYTIRDDEGFVPGSTHLTVVTELAGVWNHHWDGEFSHGAWYAIDCFGQIDFLFGSSGMQIEEMQPEYSALDLVQVELPAGLGHFYGRCHQLGEIWHVSIDGVEYSAEVVRLAGDSIPLPQNIE